MDSTYQGGEIKFVTLLTGYLMQEELYEKFGYVIREE
jgi:hypothetical protein